ncbi:MAG: PleD family two-component system response regulator [Kofleriaceae bacterium]
MATILIVDDSSAARDLLGGVVRATGHEPIFCESGADSLQTASAYHPALIFMDIVMPGLDGFASCRALKKNETTSKIPVVLVSSKVAPSDKFWGKKQGADDYIDKPFSVDTVTSVIRRYVG